MATRSRQTKTPESAKKKIAPRTTKTSLAAKIDGQTTARPVLRFKKIHLVILLGGLVLIGFLFASRGYFIAATVNGQPISRFSVTSELETLYGKNSLEQKITSALIFQEAEKKGIRISNEEVEKEYKKSEDTVKRQGQDLKQVLAYRGYTPETYKNQIKIQKIAEKLFEKDAQVTDKEIDEYLEQNKESQHQDVKPEDLRENAKQTLRQQKIYSKYQSWVDGLKKNAKVNYFVTY